MIMSNITLYEATHYSIILNKCCESTLTWGNSPLTVQTDKGLDVFEFSHDVVTYTRNMHFNVSCVPCPETIPCKSFFPSRLFKEKIPNQEYTRCVLDPNLWSHDENIAEKMICVYMFEWLQIGQNNILVILTNAGSIEFLIRSRLGYLSIFNFTSMLEQRNEIKKVKFTSLDYIYDLCKSVLASSFCWALNEETIYFVTAQRNGDILFWNLKYKDDIDIIPSGKISTANEEIVKIVWITHNNKKILICSFLNGKVTAYEFDIINGEIKLLNEIILWKYEDNMPIKYMLYKKEGDNIILIYCKHRHLVIQLLDSQFIVIDSVLKNIDDYKIVGLIEWKGNYVVGTSNFHLALVTLNIRQSKLIVSYNDVHINSSLVKDCFLERFDLSSNKVIWVFIVSSKNSKVQKYSKSIKLLFLHLGEEDQTEINLLLQNPSKNLANMSDCIEIMKFKANKYKILPNINYNLLFIESNEDIYKLKVYLILLILYKNRICISSKNINYNFPESSIDKIRDKIFIMQSLTMLKNISAIYNNSGTITEFQKEVYFGCKQYLELYCKKYKRNINNLFVDTLDMDINFKYICQFCDEELVGFACKHNHINQFCSVTFIPITDDKYLECRACGLTARYELFSEKPTCTLCDLPLSDCFLPT